MSRRIALENRLHEREKGFTLIELLVAIAIIAIITAIAVPVFLNQRKKANDTVLRSDLKNAALSVEAVSDIGLMDSQSRNFVASITGTGANGAIYADIWNTFDALPKVALSQDTVIQIDYTVVQPNTYCLIGRNTKSNYKQNSDGTVTRLFYDPLLGGVVDKARLTEAKSSGIPSSCSYWG